MTSVTFSLLLQSALLGAGEPTYAAAYKQAVESEKPLVVLVGADWCPACRTMKQSVIPNAKKDGALDGVVFATINTDKENDLANKVMQGGTIPQLIVFRKTADGWTRDQLTGAQSVASIRQLLAKKADKPVAEVTRRAK